MSYLIDDEVGHIVEGLLDKARKELDKELDEIVIKNNSPLFIGSNYFIYQNQVFSLSTAAHKTPSNPKIKLRFSLYSDMQKFLLKKRALSNDRHSFTNLLNTLLKYCSSREQIRNALPEFLIRFSLVKAMPRTAPFSPKLTQDYLIHEQVLNKMAVHAAMDFLS